MATMAGLMRKYVLSVRSIVQARKLCLLARNDIRTRRLTIDNREINLEVLKNLKNKQLIHTSSVYNRIVAFNLSDIGEGIREVVIKEWFVKEGDQVQQFDNICEVQSDKAAVTITSRYDGVITKLYHQVDKIALVGQPLLDIEVQEDAPKSEETTSQPHNKVEVVEKQTSQTDDDIEESNARINKVLTTPSVRRIASQYKLDLKTVVATGKKGRILKEDVLKHLNINSDTADAVPILEQTKSKPSIVQEILEDKVVPVTGFTKAMVKSMTEALKIPHFVYSDEYDVTKLVEARKELKQIAKEKGVHLTYMPIILKAASLCLYSFPIINSSLDSTCENLIYKANHNIGVAMNTPNGLVVPVIKNVQHKTILEVAKELNRLQESGMKGQLNLNDLTGGTFTISNIGIVGGTYTKPVIFPPQVSIGAIGKIQVLPRFNAEDKIVKAHILSVSWSADHRVVDGVTMASFSEALKKYLENPSSLLLEL